MRMGRGHVAVLAEHGIDQPAVPVDGAIQTHPPAADLEMGFLDVPPPAAGAALAMPPQPEFVGQHRRELPFPVPDCLGAEDDPTVQEHLAEVL